MGSKSVATLKTGLVKVLREWHDPISIQEIYDLCQEDLELSHYTKTQVASALANMMNDGTWPLKRITRGIYQYQSEFSVARSDFFKPVELERAAKVMPMPPSIKILAEVGDMLVLKYDNRVWIANEAKGKDA